MRPRGGAHAGAHPRTGLPEIVVGRRVWAEEVGIVELEGEGLASLRLITRRDPYMHNSWYANVPAMKRGERDRNRA